MFRILTAACLTALVLCFATVRDAHADKCGNGVVNAGEQCDDGNNAPFDGCAPNCTVYPGFQCTNSSPSICSPPVGVNCGNGVIDANEQCDDGNLVNGDGCMTSCAVQPLWRCEGVPSVCTLIGTTIDQDCGNGVVDSGEQCDDANRVSGDGCQGNCTVQSGYECTGSPSVCNPSETVLNCGNGTVDDGEACDGGGCCSSTCTLLAAGATCHASAGVCDPAETCDGVSADCPADALSDSATVCREASSPCDAGETCTGASAACPVDVESCVEICRSPKFWATRGTTKSGSGDVVDDVLDRTGPVTVCGQQIDAAADIGTLNSASEALCVRKQGVDERDLFRQLVTTALNCAVSEGGTCDDIVSRFVDVSYSACDALCAGDAAPGGPTMDDCASELACFNGGGQVIGGRCAVGTCSSGLGEPCGGDYADCASGACEPFAGNCADARLCADDDASAQICPTGLRALNKQECREARSNDCTIDSCP